MKTFRWDQGRVSYLEFETIQCIALAMRRLKGAHTSEDDAHIRRVLAEHTDLPFLPQSYTVWRNYGRTIKCALIATSINKRVETTELCEALANNEISVDEYLIHHVTRMALPGPIFKSDETEAKCIVGSALIKVLMARGKTDYRTLLGLLKKNEINGHESESEIRLKLMTRGSAEINADELRQFREYIHFLAQGTFLAEDDESAWLRGLSWPLDSFNPVEINKASDEEHDILELGRLTSSSFKYIPTIGIDAYLDILVSEGKATSHTTTRYERSPELRAAYQAKHGANLACDICCIAPKKLYKTKSELIELHHVMPLSSLQDEVENGIKDLVALCPTCHKAIHSRYSQHLKSLSRTYFTDKEEAWRVYSELKTEFKTNLTK